MAEDGDPVQPGAEHHGNGHKAALGENHVRFDLSHQVRGLEGAGDHAEGIGKILPGKITAQLAAFYRVIGDARNGAHLRRFHAVLRADVMDLIAFFLKAGDQRQVRRHMAQGAAAGQNDLLHQVTPCKQNIKKVNIIKFSGRQADSLSKAGRL